MLCLYSSSLIVHVDTTTCFSFISKRKFLQGPPGWQLNRKPAELLQFPNTLLPAQISTQKSSKPAERLLLTRRCLPSVSQLIIYFKNKQTTTTRPNPDRLDDIVSTGRCGWGRKLFRHWDLFFTVSSPGTVGPHWDQHSWELLPYKSSSCTHGQSGSHLWKSVLEDCAGVGLANQYQVKCTG